MIKTVAKYTDLFRNGLSRFMDKYKQTYYKNVDYVKILFSRSKLVTCLNLRGTIFESS